MPASASRLSDRRHASRNGAVIAGKRNLEVAMSREDALSPSSTSECSEKQVMPELLAAVRRVLFQLPSEPLRAS
jgi:hypothetical protein